MATTWVDVIDGAATTVGAVKGDTGATGPQGPAGPQGEPGTLTVTDGSVITATGTTTARTLADRFATQIDVRDRGAAIDGSTDDTAAVQAVIDLLAARGGGVAVFPAGTCLTTGLTLKDGVTLEGQGKGASVIKLKNATNQHVVGTVDFDTYANGVDRASPVGCKTGGLRRLSLDGNKANQSTAKHGLAYYGVDLQLDEVEIKNAKGVNLYVESPGATFSVFVGRNLQTNIRHIDCHDGGLGNIYYNGQSDSTGIDIMAYETDNASGSYHIKFGQKSTGVRWFGVHVWGNAEWGWINEANTAGFYTCHMEQPVWLKNTTYFTGRVYHGNTASDLPAFVVDSTAGSSDLEARITGFKYAVKFTTTDPGNSLYRLRHYSPEAGSEIIDPSGGTTFNATSIRECLATNVGNADELSFPGPVRAVASANYSELRGAAASGRPRVEFAGTDATVNGALAAAGGGGIAFFSDTTLTARQFNVEHTASAVSYLSATGAATGVAGPQLLVRSSETDVDLRLVPKGAGVLRFGTHTANADAAITGYVLIKTADGTTRKLAVIA